MKRLFPLGLIGLGLLLLMTGTVGLWINKRKVQKPIPAPLPERIAEMSLTYSLLAEEAIAEFTRLHGDDFPLTSGSVGMYGSDRSVTLWVAGASYQATANRLLVTMREKIAGEAGSSPFSPVGERKDGSRTIYELEGMGQKHFYFQSGKMIVWLAVNPERAEEVLAQVLKFYP